MYVPGDDARKIAKIPSLNVDCPVLECEDGVAANKKVFLRFFYSKRRRGLDPPSTSSFIQQFLFYVIYSIYLINFIDFIYFTNFIVTFFLKIASKVTNLSTAPF